MMRWILRTGAMLVLVLWLVPAVFANSPAKSKSKKVHEKTNETTTLSSSNAKTEDTALPAETSPAAAEPQAQMGYGSRSADDEAAPKVIPMLATTGTIGLFTVETADTLPKHGFAFSVFGNKFGRMPGSVTVFQLGLDASYGITDRLNIYGSFVPYGHTHLGNPSQLSLAPPNNNFPQFPGSIYHRLGVGAAPGYVEDFPLAGNNGGGVGELTLGLKYGLLSERHGAPVSLSVRNDFIIPTRRSLEHLLENNTQSGQFNDMVSLAVSKKWRNIVTATWDVGFRFTRDPKANGLPLLDMANQFRTGAGIILLPESRIQPMMEYTAVVFTGKDATQNTTFGPRDPVDGVWGVRLYPWKNIGIDVGYRYMLNLKNAHDRNGFVIKIGAAYWPEKAAPPPQVNHLPTVSCSTDKSMVYVGSGDTVAVTASAIDVDNNPLTYVWSASGGRIEGSGPQVRWLSTGTTAGTYAATVRVDDGKGGTASCSSNIRVEPTPNRPPTIACSAESNSVFAGERVHLTAKATDPDGDPLTYTWRSNAGKIVGSGAAVDFDTTGLAPNKYSVTVRVDDGHNGAADCSMTVEVKAAPPAPQASKVNQCAFDKLLSSRIDNVCKRILDDIALRLQNDPRATTVIIGYSDPKERNPQKVSGDRASNAVKYLGEKGISASRVTTRTGSGQAGADKQNRRIDVIWVPEGATY